MKRWLVLCLVVAACGNNHSNPQVDGNSGGDSHAASDSNGTTSDGSTSSNFAARRICSGEAHSCAILANGNVKCWGYNAFGQLGLGDNNNRGDAPDEMGAVLPTVQLGTGRSAVELACGATHTCALLDDQTVKCWGNNGYAQLGLGDTNKRGDNVNEMGDHLPVVQLGAGLVPVQLATTYDSTCVRFSTGGVKCWGAGAAGELGNGGQAVIGDQATEMGAALPFVDLGVGRTAKFLAGGIAQPGMCAILDNDQLKCWGENEYGQLGLGDSAARGNSGGQMGDSLPFVDLATVSVHAVSTSGIQSCAIVTPDKIRCWGQGVDGALGDGTYVNRGDQANEMGGNLGMVPIGGTPLAIGVGGNFACATTTTGLYCWGNNAWGQLGIGTTANQGDDPGEVAALAPIALGTTQMVEQLAVGDNQVCVLLADGSIRCWGNGSLGALGTGAQAPVGNSSGQMGSALSAVSL